MMGTPLPYTISDFEGRELLAKGHLLNRAVISKIANQGRNRKNVETCLLKHGAIRSDLEAFMHENSYPLIFGGEKAVKNHLAAIDEVPIPVSLLRALNELKEHDFYTYRHSLVVFATTTFLMGPCCTKASAGKSAYLAGPTHDLGKLLVPRTVLNKPTPLTHDERRLIEFHPIGGFILLSYYLGDPMHPAAQVALNHHERLNGTGYPRGRQELDPLVDMVATCDIYDALISDRPYRSGNYDNRTALEELAAIAEAGALGWCSIKTLVCRHRSEHPTPEQVHISQQRRVAPSGHNYHSIIVNEEQKHVC